METHRVLITGPNIVDKHTHDEYYPYVGSQRTTVIIPGYISADFKRRYGFPLQRSTVIVDIEFIPNKERVKECQNSFNAPGHLIGTLRDLEGIISVEEYRM